MILIVAGVSGSGKTTVGAMLAGRLDWPFADADDFHPAANIEKMRSGIPLTDEDRQPWLRAIAAWMDERIAAGESAVIDLLGAQALLPGHAARRPARGPDGLPGPGSRGAGPAAGRPARVTSSPGSCSAPSSTPWSRPSQTST